MLARRAQADSVGFRLPVRGMLATRSEEGGVGVWARKDLDRALGKPTMRGRPPLPLGGIQARREGPCRPCPTQTFPRSRHASEGGGSQFAALPDR